MFTYKEEECSRYAMRWGGCPFLFDKDMMFPVKYMDFEGTKVMVPNRTSDYLIWHYGDEWSYIPPHGERESHESVDVPGASYQEVRDEYMPRIDKKRIRRQMLFRKFYCLLMAKGDHKQDDRRRRIKAGVVARDVSARLMRSEKTAETLLKERRYDVLGEIFEEYYRVQLSMEFIGREDFKGIRPFYHPVLIPLEDEAFQAAMLTLIYQERVSKAYRMYEVRKKMDHLTPEMEQTVEDIRRFRKAASHYEFKEMQEAEAIVDDLLRKYPDAPGFLKFKCRFVMERLEGPQNASEAEKFLSYCLRVFPQDGYFMKYKGDLLWKKGLRNEAMAEYLKARECTNNGIVQLELDKFLKKQKSQAIRDCRDLLGSQRRSEALSLMEFWSRLMPEDEEIRGALYLAKVSSVRTKGELEELVENGAVDWIWCEGERRIIYNFAENLLKTRPAYSARAKGEYQDQVRDNQANAERLDQVIHTMQEKGSSRWRFTLRESFTLKKDREDGPGIVRVHLPLPVEYAQVESFTLLRPSEEPAFIAPAAQPHRTIFFERPMKAGETIEVEFSYTIRADYVRPDPSKVLNEQPTFYTEEQLPHIALTPTSGQWRRRSPAATRTR